MAEILERVAQNAEKAIITPRRDSKNFFTVGRYP